MRMRTAYELTIERIESELTIVTRQLAGFDAPGSWYDDKGRFTEYGMVAFRQQFLRHLLPQAQREFQRFSDTGLTLLRGGRVAAVSGGAAEAWELMEASGIDVSFQARLNTPAVTNLVGATSLDSPLRAVLDSYGGEAGKTIERLLIQSVGTGEGPRQTVRRIMDALDSGYTKARLDTLVRTESLRAYRAGLSGSYQQMSRVIRVLRWTAAKSSRTCLACLARHGREYPLDYVMDSHPACRCILTPVSVRSTQSSESGEDWLRRQPVDTRRRMFPSGASFDAFEDGDVRLADFVGRRRSAVWGPSIYERSGAQVLGGAR